MNEEKQPIVHVCNELLVFDQADYNPREKQNERHSRLRKRKVGPPQQTQDPKIWDKFKEFAKLQNRRSYQDVEVVKKIDHRFRSKVACRARSTGCERIISPVSSASTTATPRSVVWKHRVPSVTNATTTTTNAALIRSRSPISRSADEISSKTRDNVSGFRRQDLSVIRTDRATVTDRQFNSISHQLHYADSDYYTAIAEINHPSPVKVKKLATTVCKAEPQKTSQRILWYYIDLSGYFFLMTAGMCFGILIASTLIWLFVHYLGL